MKKYYLFIILLILISVVTSCSVQDGDMAENAGNAQAFDYFTTYEINETNYSIYLPNNIEVSLYYTHEVSNVKSDSSEWIVNFSYEPVYHLDEDQENKDVWSKLYEKLAESENILEEKCNFDVMLFDPYSTVKLEFVLKNQDNEEATYVTLITYLPVRMYNHTTRKTITVGIPVNVDVLLKVGVMVK